MDDYIDEFKDLIDLAGYKEGLAIVMKFHKGLRHDIQDQIVQLAHGHPADHDIGAWYDAALCCAENLESNALFHGSSRAPTIPHFRVFPTAPAPTSSVMQPRFQQNVQPQRTPQNPVPMDVDVARKKAQLPDVCYRCGEPGHRKPQCPRRFDIRHMTMEECDEWWQQRALDRDVQEIEEGSVREEEEDAQDFRSRSE